MRNNNFKKRFNKISRYFLILVTICTFSLSCEKAPDIEEITEMSFTIDTRLNPDNPTDKSYVLPIFAYKLIGCSLTVEWGDGTKTKYPEGSRLVRNDPNNDSKLIVENITHIYANEGVYQIKVIETVTNLAKRQKCFFRADGDGFSNNNNRKLVSMDSPMLNMSLEDRDYIGGGYGGDFAYCSNLKSVHPDLFKYNADKKIFSCIFEYCESLTEIPADLFKYNVNATNFTSAFNGCSSLKTVPADLFKYNVKTERFLGTFSGCSSLTTIPADLFRYNTMAGNFESVFQNCTKLTEAPSGLFKYNTLSSCFSKAFGNCYNLKLNQGIFSDNNDEEKATRFVKFNDVRFNGCFENVGRDLADVSVSVAPELWNYKYTARDYFNKEECFKNARIANINEIPRDSGF